MPRFKIPVSLILIVTLLAGCSLHRSNAQLMDHSYLKERYGTDLSRRDLKEIEVGQEIHRRILTSFSVYENETAGQYVEEICDQLGGAAKRNHFSYHCTILDSNKIYATGAPGGNIYITTGFIRLLDNEAELAGVLAHEIAHLQYRNPKHSDLKKMLKAMELAVGVAGGLFGGFGVLAFLGVATVNYFYDEKKIEKRVRVADRRTVQYLFDSGYDPQGFLDVLYKIIYADRSLIPYLVDYYEVRPVNVDRMNQLDESFQKLDFLNTTFDTHRERFLTMMADIKTR